MMNYICVECLREIEGSYIVTAHTGSRSTYRHLECPSDFNPYYLCPGGVPPIVTVYDDEGKIVEPLQPALDPVNPAHYASQGEYSALHVVQKWGLGFCLGNALKYISRAGKKPGESEVTDLKKAVWYIRRHIHEIDPKEPDPAAPENRP